ncbi:MAG: phosphotransferase [Bacteroidaceae bacterium]|nr:phosphotransferase [Bacteroidaceae bacterium]
METLRELFEQWSGRVPTHTESLKASGSDRKYVRLSSGDISAIGVEGTSTEENRAFISICRHLHAKGLPVPELYAVSADCTCYLQEDLGDTQLYDFMAECRKENVYDGDTTALLHSVMERLADFQFHGADGMDFSVCYPVESFNRRSIFWDLNYFKYYCLKPSGLEFNEDILENDFERMAGILLTDEPFSTFMYRDFQSRNIMVCGSSPRFIDFQGGRRGPVEYDLVSFLWQARAAYPDELKDNLTSTYIKSLSKYRKVDETVFRTRLIHFVLFRTMQVLGAYGYRGNFERKQQFLDCMPAAMANLHGIACQPVIRDTYPYMSDILYRLTGLARYKSPLSSADDRLTVKITSFSYRKGIPEDDSGNGGGFVFDCRSMHNPGLYDRYKALTGLDNEVIEFLDNQGEIQVYLHNVYGLTDAAVNKYLSRGFTGLAVNFGCTGGRHRSVRCAECLAAHLHGTFGDRIRILVTHRELNLHRKI